MILVFLVYGLAFIALGIAVSSRTRGIKGLKFANTLWLLVAFAFLHGIDEWIDMFIIMGWGNSGIFVVHTLLKAASFAFLLQFGIEVINIVRVVPLQLRLAPSMLFLLWLLGAILIIPIHTIEGAIIAEIIGRYTLGFFGSAVTAYALISKRDVLAQGANRISRAMYSTGIFFGAYAFLTIITPAAQFFPASILNYTAFLEITGLPTQLFRAVCAIGIAYFTIESLNVFDIDARTKLEHANRLKELGLDIIHHDLMNPIGIIQGYAESMRGEKDPKEIEYGLQAIIRSTQRMAALIDNVARYAKLESIENIELKKKEVGGILMKVIEEFRSESKGKGIHIKSTGECHAEVHPLIEDVFSNLISNAIKYGPEGKNIVVDLKDEGKHCRIMVKDYGVGIPDKYKPGLFERFKRIEKGGVKGTGLGLAIVKRIVELHHGNVWIEDNPEGGSIFYVRIPKGEP